jgi:hypothetical protein
MPTVTVAAAIRPAATRAKRVRFVLGDRGGASEVPWGTWRVGLAVVVLMVMLLQ